MTKIIMFLKSVFKKLMADNNNKKNYVQLDIPKEATEFIDMNL